MAFITAPLNFPYSASKLLVMRRNSSIESRFGIRPAPMLRPSLTSPPFTRKAILPALGPLPQPYSQVSYLCPVLAPHKLEASLRRATPKGRETFIFRTAPHQGLAPTSSPPHIQDTPRHAQPEQAPRGAER